MFKCHPECKSDCCGPVIMPVAIWERNKHKAQNPLKELFNLSDGNCVPATEELKCIFLKQDGKCNIYDDRPKVCRDYGLIPELECPWMKPNGNPRSLANHKHTQRIINHRVDGTMSQGQHKSISIATFIYSTSKIRHYGHRY